MARKPASLDFAHAAAVPLAALTALQALRDELAVREGMRVFIPGGAGGVGTFASSSRSTSERPSRRRRRPVVGPSSNVSARTSSSTTPGRTSGRSSATTTRRSTSSAAIRLRALFSVVRRGGKVVSIAGIPEPTTATKDLHRGAGLATLFWFASAGLRLRAWRAGVVYRYMFMGPSGKELDVLASLVDTKKLEVVVDQRLPVRQDRRGIRLSRGRPREGQDRRHDGGARRGIEGLLRSPSCARRFRSVSRRSFPTARRSSEQSGDLARWPSAHRLCRERRRLPGPGGRRRLRAVGEGDVRLQEARAEAANRHRPRPRGRGVLGSLRAIGRATRG